MVAELAHEYPPKIKYIVIPKRRLVQSSHSTSNPYSYSPYSTPFDSNTNNHHNHSSNNSYETQQHIRNRYLMLLEREKNRTERSPSPPRTSTLTLPSSSASRLSTIFREASGGFPAVPLSSSYRNPLRIITIDRDRDNGLTPSMTSRKVESDNRSSSRLGSIESNVESLLRKRRLGEYDESARVGGEGDRLREDSETKRFREESERLAGLIDFIRRRDDSLAAIARGSVPIVDDDSDSEDDEEENDPLKSEMLKYESEWAVDTFVHSDDEDEDEEDEDEDEESDAIPYSIAKPSSTLLANTDQQTEESSSSGSELNEESETVDRRNTNQIYRSHVDDNSDSESDEER